MANTNNATDTRRQAISRLAQAIDKAREMGMTSFGVASALAVAMWETHGVMMGTNADLVDEATWGSGVDDMTAHFEKEVARG